MSEVSKFFLWKCFEAGNGASYRLELSRSTDLFANWNFFLYTICNRIYGRCVLGKGKGRVQSGEDRIVSWFFPVIVEGPICRWEDVEGTLFKNESVKARMFLMAVIGSSGDCLKR